MQVRNPNETTEYYYPMKETHTLYPSQPPLLFQVKGKTNDIRQRSPINPPPPPPNTNSDNIPHSKPRVPSPKPPSPTRVLPPPPRRSPLTDPGRHGRPVRRRARVRPRDGGPLPRGGVGVMMGLDDADGWRRGGVLVAGGEGGDAHGWCVEIVG